MLNWNDLRVVAAIHRTGSLSKAARDMEVDDTTIGRRLARLEAALGVTLFEAAHGRREPTEECKAILQQLSSIEQAAEEIRVLLQEHRTPMRRFRLTAIAAIAEHYLSPALIDLLLAEPGLALSIDTSDQNVDMSRWEADFAIRLGRPKQGAFIMRRIGTLRFCLVRPRLREARPMIAAYPGALAEAPEMVALRDALGGDGVRLETSNLSLIRQFLESGRGGGVIPEVMARPLATNPALEVTPLEVKREVWLLSQPHLRDDPMARTVADWCAGLLA